MPPPSAAPRHTDDRSLPMGQMDIMEENLPYQQEVNQDPSLMVSLPAENQDIHPEQVNFDYMTDMPNNYASLSSDGTSAVVRLKRPNCAVWDFALSEKKTVKIRLGLQDGQLFLALEDIIINVCGVTLSYEKMMSMTKNMVPVEFQKSKLFYSGKNVYL